jgi:hypothetical protein
MTNLNNSRRLVGALCASTVLGLSSITPAFGAAFNAQLIDGQLTPRNLVLLTSLVLLGVALAVKLVQKRHSSAEGPAEPDLRWWLNPQ